MSSSKQNCAFTGVLLVLEIEPIFAYRELYSSGNLKRVLLNVSLNLQVN